MHKQSKNWSGVQYPLKVVISGVILPNASREYEAGYGLDQLVIDFNGIIPLVITTNYGL